MIKKIYKVVEHIPLLEKDSISTREVEIGFFDSIESARETIFNYGHDPMPFNNIPKNFFSFTIKEYNLNSSYDDILKAKSKNIELYNHRKEKVYSYEMSKKDHYGMAENHKYLFKEGDFIFYIPLQNLISNEVVFKKGIICRQAPSEKEISLTHPQFSYKWEDITYTIFNDQGELDHTWENLISHQEKFPDIIKKNEQSQCIDNWRVFSQEKLNKYLQQKLNIEKITQNAQNNLNKKEFKKALKP